MRAQRKHPHSKADDATATGSPQRLLHELQVHQIELEMQNTELEESRDRSEGLLEKYSDLYDFAPVGFFSLDPQGVIIEANLTGAAALGLERSRLLKRRMLSFVGRSDRQAFLDFLERIYTKQGTQTCEAVVSREDATSFWAGFHGRLNLPGIGPEKCCQIVVSDITLLKEAEEALRQSEALFSVLIEQVPVGVYVVDGQLRLRQVNPKARPVFKDIDGLIGQELADVLRILWPAKVAAKILARFQGTLDSGRPYFSSSFSERRRDLRVKEFYEWQLQRVAMPSGGYGVVCFFNDVTERKQAEATRRNLDIMTASNRKLEIEIARRQKVEKALRRSEQGQRRSLEESRLMQGQLRGLSRQVLKAQEEERRRISRELHDVIAQTLTGIEIRLANLKTETGRNVKDFARTIAQTQRLVLKSVHIVHEFARELRPAVLDDLGLVPALHSFMNGFAARTGLQTGLTASAAVESLDTVRRTVLFRVAQEALNNVARHAKGASRVDVLIERTSVGLRMRVKDDGRPFSAIDVLRAVDGKQLGLLGMRERLEMIGGSFAIASSPAGGTVITAQIPLRRPRGRESKALAAKTGQDPDPNQPLP